MPMPTHDEKKAIFAPKPGSDESDAIKLKSSGIHQAHLCEHPGCRKDDGWGFGRPGHVGGEIHWYCYEHRKVGAHAF